MVSIKLFQIGITLALALFFLSKCSSPALDHMRAEDERRTKYVNDRYARPINRSGSNATATSPAKGGKEGSYAE